MPRHHFLTISPGRQPARCESQPTSPCSASRNEDSRTVKQHGQCFHFLSLAPTESSNFWYPSLTWGSSLCMPSARHNQRQARDSAYVFSRLTTSSTFSSPCPIHRLAAIVEHLAQVLAVVQNIRQSAKCFSFHAIDSFHRRACEDHTCKSSGPLAVLGGLFIYRLPCLCRIGEGFRL